MLYELRRKLQWDRDSVEKWDKLEKFLENSNTKRMIMKVIDDGGVHADGADGADGGGDDSEETAAVDLSTTASTNNASTNNASTNAAMNTSTNTRTNGPAAEAATAGEL